MMFAFFKHIIYTAAFTTGCFSFCSCTNTQADIDEVFKKKLGVEEGINVKVNFTTGGRPKAVLTSPLMLRVQDTIPYIEFPKTLEVKFYNEEGIHESTLTAFYARYKETEELVFLKDSVKIINTKGEILYCDELYWDRKRTGKEFYTDKPVRIRTGTHVIDGIGMEARQDFKEYKILKPVGNIKVAGDELP